MSSCCYICMQGGAKCLHVALYWHSSATRKLHPAQANIARFGWADYFRVRSSCTQKVGVWGGGEWYSLCKHFLPGQRVQYAMESILQWLLLSSLASLLLFDSIRWCIFVHSKIAWSKREKKSLAPSSYATNVRMHWKVWLRKSLCCYFFSSREINHFWAVMCTGRLLLIFCTLSSQWKKYWNMNDKTVYCLTSDLN